MKSSTLIKLSLSAVALLCGAATAQAATIVQLGAQGGDIGMVTASGSGPNTAGAIYDAATLYSPSGALGYTGQEFGGVVLKRQGNNWADNAGGDYIQLLANVSANPTLFYEAMLAWNGGANNSGQSAFLGSSSDTVLESFHIEFKGRGSSNSPTVSFLLETSTGWYQANETVQVIGNAYASFDANIASLTWTGYSQFGVSAGAGTTPDTADIVSVGFYFSDTATSGNFSGGMVRNFEVTAISGGDQAPTAAAQSVQYVLNTPASITLAGSDPEGSSLTYSVGTPTNGTLSGTAPDLTYTPSADYTGSDSFTFTVNDGTTDSDPATVSITLNQAPTADAQSSVQAAINTPLSITLTGSDPEGSNLTYSVGAPTNGTLSGTAPDLTYTPSTDYTGSDSFTFTVNDGLVDSASATVSIVVSNGAPTADAQSVQVVINTALSIVLTGSDPDDGIDSWTVASTPTNGVLSGTAPNLTYTPTTNYTGSDSFTFTVTDGTTVSSAATVSIFVSTTVQTNAVYADVTGAAAFTSATDLANQGQATFASSTVSANQDPGTPEDGFNDGVTESNKGSMTWFRDDVQPTQFPGEIVLNLDVSTNSAGYNITTINSIAGYNIGGAQADQVMTVEYSVVGDTSYTTLGTYSNEAADTQGQYSSISLADYLNGNLATGVDSLRFTYANPAANTRLVIQEIDVIGSPNNVAPTAAAQSVQYVLNTPASITLAGSDPEGSSLTYSVGTPTNGTLSGTAPDLTYTPSADYTGSDSFTFTVNDGTTDSDPATVSITLNQAPTADAQSSVQAAINTPLSITLTGSDPEGSNLTYSVGAPTNGTLSGTAPDLTYTPSTDYTGSDSFTFTVNDGTTDSASATVSIVVSNGAPTADAQSVQVVINTALSIVLTGSDPDDGIDSWTVASTPTNGVLSGTAPNLTYTPTTNYTGSDSFTFTVTDGTTVSSAATVSIFVSNAVQTNVVYPDVNGAAAFSSDTDLANQGQATFASSTVSANSSENGFNDGVTASSQDNITWFRADVTPTQFPGEIVVNLDVSSYTSGYNITSINSIAGYNIGGKQADQVMTVEYSVVGDASYTMLGTFSNETADTQGQYSSISLADYLAGNLATGVDSLRFTYADPAANTRLVIQEIDVIGSPIIESKVWVGSVDGNWDSTTGNWSGGSDNLFSDGNSITFDDTASTQAVVIDGASVAPSSVIFSNTSGNNYTLSSAADETLDGTGGISATGTGDVTISSGIIGSGGFTQSGSGKTILSGANTYSGDTSVSAGTLEIGGAGSLGVSGNYAGAIANSGALIFNSSTNQSLSGVISAAGGLVQGGAGTLTLTGENTYAGSTTVSAGATLKVTTQNALGDTAGATTVAAGATLELAYAPQTNPSPITESLTISGDGVSGTEGAIKVTAGQIAEEYSGTITLASDATINIAARWDTGGTVTDGDNSFTLTKIGTEQWRPSATADYAHLVINEGEFELSSVNALPSDTVTVNSGARLDTWGNMDLTQTGHTPSITFNDGSSFIIDRNGAVVTIGGVMVLNGNVEFIKPGSGGSLTVISAISGTGALTLESGSATPGSMTFSGNNTYSATTIIGDGAVGAGSMILYAGSTTGFSNNSDFQVSANSSLKLNGLSNTIGSLGDFSAAGGTVENDNATAATLTIGDNGNSTTFSGIIQDGAGGGALSLTKIGSGTMTISGANTYTGATTVNAGTLDIDSIGTYPSAITVAAAGSLEVDLGTTLALQAALSVDAASQIVIDGTPTLASYTLISATLITGTPVLSASIEGYALEVNGQNLELNALPTNDVASWAASYTASDAAFTGSPATDPLTDYDNDGLSNLLEYVLGGSPIANQDTAVPTVSQDATYMIFTYNRSDISTATGNDVTIVAEYAADLSGSWTAAVNGTASVVIEENTSADPDVVTVKVPLAGTEQFIRLNVLTGP